MTRQSSRELAQPVRRRERKMQWFKNAGSAESLCRVELVNVAQPFRTWQIVQCALGHDLAGPHESPETSTKMARSRSGKDGETLGRVLVRIQVPQPQHERCRLGAGESRPGHYGNDAPQL